MFLWDMTNLSQVFCHNCHLKAAPCDHFTSCYPNRGMGPDTCFDILTSYLAYILTSILYPHILASPWPLIWRSQVLPDIYSDILSGILPDTYSGN